MENFDNTARNRYYGVRVGDTVRYGIPGQPDKETCEVIRYGFMDNNRVILRSKSGKEIRAVAEWCEVIEKVEDKQC